MMPWHSLHHPSLLEPTTIHYMKKNWNFAKNPIVVVLDQQGRVANPNALHLMWIWGSAAFPFTSVREDVLWKEETWHLELLIDGIDSLILSWDSFSSVLEISHGEIFGAELDSAIPATKLQWVPGYNLLMAVGSHGAWVLEEIGWLLEEKINNLLRCGRVHPRRIVTFLSYIAAHTAGLWSTP